MFEIRTRVRGLYNRDWTFSKFRLENNFTLQSVFLTGFGVEWLTSNLGIGEQTNIAFASTSAAVCEPPLPHRRRDPERFEFAVAFLFCNGCPERS